MALLDRTEKLPHKASLLLGTMFIFYQVILCIPTIGHRVGQSYTVVFHQLAMVTCNNSSRKPSSEGT